MDVAGFRQTKRKGHGGCYNEIGGESKG